MAETVVNHHSFLRYGKLLMQQQLSRSSVLWLLCAYVLVILPQFWSALPLWVLPLWCVCFIWRLLIFRTRLSFPPLWLKIILVIAATVGMVAGYGNFFNPEGASIFLVIAFSFKLLECKTIRDGWILIVIAYFLVGTGFLFQNSVFFALYNLIPIWIITSALLCLQPNHPHHAIRFSLTKSAQILMQAIPVMVLLFIFFPRLPPLWQLPNPQNKEAQARTGLSDNMTPGDIAELSQSGERIFVAEFIKNTSPERAQLYWRALVLDYFDGRSWRMSNVIRHHQQPLYTIQGNALSYQVIMEGSGNPWLYTLDTSKIEGEGFRYFSDFRIEYLNPIAAKMRYVATAYPLAKLGYPQEHSVLLNQALQLPIAGNPKTRQLVETLKNTYPNNAQAIAAALLDKFKKENYSYTLTPQTLGENSIDEFLFVTKEGFCEHYAGATTFILRAAGIPARVVTGFQGGELDANGQLVEVRGYDAHAWVEYFDPQSGWVRLDPTFAIAAERIENGLLSMLDSETQSHITGNRGLGVRYYFQRWMERVDYQWAKWVLGYNKEEQESFLSTLLPDFSWRQIFTGLIILLIGIFLLQALWLLKPWQESSPLHSRLVQSLIQHLRQRADLPAGITLQEILQLDIWQTEERQHIQKFIEHYEALRYQDAQHTQQLHLQAMKQHLKAILR